MSSHFDIGKDDLTLFPINVAFSSICVNVVVKFIINHLLNSNKYFEKKNPKFNWKHDKHLKYGYSSYIILLGVTFWHSILEIKIATLFHFCIKLVWMYAFYQVNLFGFQFFFEKVRNHSHTLWKRPCRKIETILTSVTKL